MFEFNEKNHAYKLDGKRLTGVTTIIGILDKPALIGWASNQAVDYIKNNSYKAKGTENIVLENEFILEEARKAWCIKRDKAGDVGSFCHSWIEEFVKYDIVHKHIDNKVK